MKPGDLAASLACAALTLALLGATSAVAKDGAPTASKHKAGPGVDPRPVGTVPKDISPEAAEIVWLFHHGSDNEKLLYYVNMSHQDFKLSVDDVNYLKDIGISTDVVFAMIRTPQARENIVRLRSHQPMWRVSKHKAKQEEPQTALQNIELREEQQLDAAPENHGVPEYYGPANNAPYPHPLPQRYPNGTFVPGPYNRFDNGVPHPGEPGYNGYNGQRIVP